MLGVLQFIFSDILVFCGAVILLSIICDAIASIFEIIFSEKTMTKERMYLLGFNTAIDRMVEECEEKAVTDSIIKKKWIDDKRIKEIAKELKERVNGL